jgi:hypothetical protein
MPHLTITAAAARALEATPAFSPDPHAEHHPDGSVTFYLDAMTVLRLQRSQRPGESLSDVIQRACARAMRT